MNNHSTAPAPRALVVFAGAKPNELALSVAHFSATRPLDALFIYHTQVLAAEADRARKFCNRQWPSLKTVVACEPGDETPMSVASRLRDWRIMRKDITDWTYDISGAAPSMLAAVSRVVCEEGGAITAFADGTPAGQTFRAASGGRLIPEPPAPPPSAKTDFALDLPSYLEFAALRPAEITWSGSRPAVKLSPKEVAAIAAAGAENNWLWRDAFKQATGKYPPAEWDFEDFIASTLTAIGIRAVRVHVAVKITDKTPAEDFYDIVAFHNGAVWTFDCHAGADSPEKTDSRPWRLFFGQRMVVVRPDRLATRTETILTSKDRILLDASDCRSLFDCLASMMSVLLPGEFDGVERRSLSRAATAKLPVFAPSSQASKFSEAMRLSQGVYNLKRGAAADAGGEEPPWYAVRLSADLWAVSGSLKKQVTVTEGRNRFETTLSRSRLAVAVAFFELAENRLDWSAVIRTKDAAAFAKWLQKWQNIPFFA